MKKTIEPQETAAVCKTPLISIIVPVYQVKAYLSECVESLLEQTYTNLEILLVDDGSTDGSGAVCDEYAAKDDRVQVVHQENKGPSAARNEGLDCAKGEYVAFVDSDDVVLPDYIKVLYHLAVKYQADIVACAYVKCSEDNLSDVKNTLINTETVSSEQEGAGGCSGMRRKQVQNAGKSKVFCTTSGQMLQRWHGKYKKWETIACNKLYRKHIFDGGEAGAVRFPIGRKLEDVLTSHLIVANAERVVITMRVLYLYRIRSDSRASQSRRGELMNENLRAQRERMAFFRERRYWRAYLNLMIGYLLHVVWFGWKRVTQCK